MEISVAKEVIGGAAPWIAGTSACPVSADRGVSALRSII